MTSRFFILSLLLLPAYAYAADSTSRYNTNQPIEINSDSLEVLQEEGKAVFSGHVVAVQGDVRLKSDKMTVYRGPEQQGKASEGDSSIKRIEVDGNVFLSTPEETASGNAGIYDVAGKVITLTNNVVLTRGKNVLKGDQLVYNLTTGKSVINSGGVASAPGAPAKKDRVRALFVPEKEKK